MLALLQGLGNYPPLSSPSVLNKCFVSVPSLLFITNKYLSTESLAPCCLTVISYFCHLFVLFLPPLTAALPWVTECCGALQLSSVLGGVGSWCPRAKPPWVVSHILCPHLRPPPTQARDYIFQNVQFPRKCPSSSCSIWTFFISFYTKNRQQRHNWCLSPPLPNYRGKSPPRPRPLWQVLEGDPIFFPLPLPLARWLAPMQHGARWRGQGQAPELMNYKRDAERQPVRSSSKRAVTCYHLVLVWWGKLERQPWQLNLTPDLEEARGPLCSG